jgi:hypothetical protein
MTEVQKQLGTKHRFTTAHCPWANGTVEAVCKQTIRAARAMLSEMHLAPQEWPRILPALQAELNNSPSSHRAGQTPLMHSTDTQETHRWRLQCYTLPQTSLYPLSKLNNLPKSASSPPKLSIYTKKSPPKSPGNAGSKWRPTTPTHTLCSRTSTQVTMSSGRFPRCGSASYY